MLINHGNKQRGPRFRSNIEGEQNDGMPVGIMTDNGMIGKDSSMLWDPQDQYATCPPCESDENGRYYVQDDGQYGRYNGIMIDTRIPLEARKPMSLGEVPVLSYQEWLDTQNR